MKYLPTAFAQLGFAIKLMQAAEDGALKVEEIDRPLTVADGESILVLPDRVLTSQDELINVCQNNVGISFGAAAITLNRCREEARISIPDPINTEADQWVALVYQIRNAFAHDISEPKWGFQPKYAREYAVAGIRADLRQLNGVPFEHDHIGGSEGLFRLKDYGVALVLGDGLRS
jgi:hypothetical protein